MKIGTYYYPEQWPREQWERDFDNIAAHGVADRAHGRVRVVHDGAAAGGVPARLARMNASRWRGGGSSTSSSARRPRRRRSGCRRTSRDAADRSARPPRALRRPPPLLAHFARDARGGRAHRHGARRPLRQPPLGHRLADRQRVLRRLRPVRTHARGVPHNGCGESTRSIDKLNRAWGYQFWNTYYTSSIRSSCRAKSRPQLRQPAPSTRRIALLVVGVRELQQAPGGHPQAARRRPVHHDELHAVSSGLGIRRDFAETLTLYLVGHLPRHRLGKNLQATVPYRPTRLVSASNHEQMASYTGRWGLLEVQPGQVNWSGVPVLLVSGRRAAVAVDGVRALGGVHYDVSVPPGAIRRRAVPSRPGGFPTASRIGRAGGEFVQVIDEMKRLSACCASPQRSRASGEQRREHTVGEGEAPAEPQLDRARLGGSLALPCASETDQHVGLLFDFDQLWYYASLPQSKRWDQPKWVTTWYGSPRAARPADRRAACRPPRRTGRAIRPYSLCRACKWWMTRPCRTLAEYAARGGHPRAARVAPQRWTNRAGVRGPLASPILDLIGGRDRSV